VITEALKEIIHPALDPIVKHTRSLAESIESGNRVTASFTDGSFESWALPQSNVEIKDLVEKLYHPIASLLCEELLSPSLAEVVRTLVPVVVEAALKDRRTTGNDDRGKASSPTIDSDQQSLPPQNVAQSLNSDPNHPGLVIQTPDSNSAEPGYIRIVIPKPEGRDHTSSRGLEQKHMPSDTLLEANGRAHDRDIGHAGVRPDDGSASQQHSPPTDEHLGQNAQRNLMRHLHRSASMPQNISNSSQIVPSFLHKSPPIKTSICKEHPALRTGLKATAVLHKTIRTWTFGDLVRNLKDRLLSMWLQREIQLNMNLAQIFSIVAILVLLAFMTAFFPTPGWHSTTVHDKHPLWSAIQQSRISS
jgi:hypothetical protein